ncbi:MAG: nicotinate-nucleotide--dimethylbenzimidazole phosphoribosyltransferase [Rhodobacteraceae bacterium]|nr:nicotinate-nucleotide--dimethylbenzimidazole phosphoribosyltransferase [Paracoccaceae bacterium]
MTAPPPTRQAFLDALRAAPGPAPAARSAAAARNAQLTKPPNALGQLEELAIWYASWRNAPRLVIRAPQIAIFAGSHGVAAQGVSAFPPEVTAQMVANFRAGGAAINQLCAVAGASLTVEALDIDTPTADFTRGPAMCEADVMAAIGTGWRSIEPDADVLVTGEMGIGNTTAAAAVACALFGGTAEDWAGRGTGLDDAGVRLKAQVVARGLKANTARDPLEVLRCLGGRELAAMAGAIARARTLSIPVILDGFVCTAAAAVLHCAVPGALDHTVAGHRSAEQAHGRLLQELGKKPLLALDMRLGEGSGAALAIQILRGALACHAGMATFAEAGVSDG